MIDILCRFDARDQQPVVFLRDTIQGDKIQVWNGKGNPQVMPLDYYKMTSPLSAEDERVLMERYKQATGKQDQQVRITHRMPRNSRPLPNMLAASNSASAQIKDINPPPAASRKTSAKPLDAQPLPQGPSGDLPQPGETPAALPAAIVHPVANETASASLFRRIQELNQRSIDLNQKIVDMNAEAQKTTTDFEATKAAIKELTVEFEKALDAEAAEELRKRKEMLAALTAVTADPLQQAAQALHDTATKAPETAPTPSAPAAATQAPAKNGNGSKGPQKAPAKTASKSAPAKK